MKKLGNLLMTHIEIPMQEPQESQFHLSDFLDWPNIACSSDNLLCGKTAILTVFASNQQRCNKDTMSGFRFSLVAYKNTMPSVLWAENLVRLMRNLPAGSDFLNRWTYMSAMTIWIGWTSHLSVMSWINGIRSGKWDALLLISPSFCVDAAGVTSTGAFGNKMASNEDEAKSNVVWKN